MSQPSVAAASPGSDLPDWLLPVAALPGRLRAADLTRLRGPSGPHRASAVLVLFGEGPDGPDLLLIERATALRSHGGQPAFPGGAVDPEDAGPAAAALREAAEETGLDAAGVHVIGQLPELWVPVSSYLVTPVLAWWRVPSPVRVLDPGEVAAVHRVPVGELVDPANRVRTRHGSGHVGPAFAVRGMLVWGFTAALLDRVLHHAGWEQPWDRSRVVPAPVPPGAGLPGPAGVPPA